MPSLDGALPKNLERVSKLPHSWCDVETVTRFEACGASIFVYFMNNCISQCLVRVALVVSQPAKKGLWFSVTLKTSRQK